MSPKRFYPWLFASFLFINGAIAQDTLLTAAYNGKLDSLNSSSLKQKRYLQVFLPPDFKPGSTDKYDVLYVLDGGNWNMGLVTQLERFIGGNAQMPPTIIVSVMGIDRNVELTPTTLSSWAAPTGGADRFLRFLTDELIPYINHTYPSNGDNTLWGHSLGGMFVLYALATKPAVFASYIAVDPSVWWDNCFVPKLVANQLAHYNGDKKTLFICGRQGPDFHGMRIDSIEAVLKHLDAPGLAWKVVAYPDETHASIRLKGIYDGLKFTYAGFSSPIEFMPANGIVIPGRPIPIWYPDDTARVHYTTNGTMPSESSPAAQRTILLDSPATVTYKRISRRARYGQSVSGSFIAGPLPVPVTKPRNTVNGGFNYRYYEGDSITLSDLHRLKPVMRGVMKKDFTKDSIPRKNNYALLIDGWLEAREDGYYEIFLKAAKGSTFSLGGRTLMECDGSREVFSYILPLSKGFYPVSIQYFNKKSDYDLLLYYLTPSMIDTPEPDPIPVPFDIRYHVNGLTRHHRTSR